MKALCIPANKDLEMHLIDIPMVDGWLRICDTMHWVFFDIVHLRTRLNFAYDLVVDDNGIANDAKINYRASMLCSNYFKDIYPIFGDALIFGHTVNEYGDYDFCDITDYGDISVFIEKEISDVKL